MITPVGMISDEFALEVLRALSKADRFGMSLHELACAVWPDRERDARQHSALGAALAELLDRGLVQSSGGKRSRYALAPEGEAWLRRFRVLPPAPAAPLRAAPVAAPADPVEAAIQAFVDYARDVAPLPPGTSKQEAYARGVAASRRTWPARCARLRAACGGDRELYELSLAEAQRRVQARIDEIHEEMLAAGEDPFAYCVPDGAGGWV